MGFPGNRQVWSTQRSNWFCSVASWLILCNKLLKDAEDFLFLKCSAYIMHSFLLVIDQVCMMNHCLDAVCTLPNRLVTYRMYTVCFSHGLILHLNVHTEKLVISCKVRYSFSGMRWKVYCYSLSATCFLLYEEYFQSALSVL